MDNKERNITPEEAVILWQASRLDLSEDYETFLRTDKHLKINSAMVFVRNLRAMDFRGSRNQRILHLDEIRQDAKN